MEVTEIRSDYNWLYLDLVHRKAGLPAREHPAVGPTVEMLVDGCPARPPNVSGAVALDEATPGTLIIGLSNLPDGEIDLFFGAFGTRAQASIRKAGKTMNLLTDQQRARYQDFCSQQAEASHDSDRVEDLPGQGTNTLEWRGVGDTYVTSRSHCTRVLQCWDTDSDGECTDAADVLYGCYSICTDNNNNGNCLDPGDVIHCPDTNADDVCDDYQELGWRNTNQIVRFMWDLVDGNNEGGSFPDDVDHTATSLAAAFEGMACSTSSYGSDAAGCNEPHRASGGTCNPSSGSSSICPGTQTATRDSYNAYDLADALTTDDSDERSLNCVDGAESRRALRACGTRATEGLSSISASSSYKVRRPGGATMTPGKHEGVTRGHRFVERDAVGSIQDVDPQRRQADLQHAVVGGEIGLADFECLQRRTERRERTIDAPRILGGGPYQDVEILRRARVAVKCDRVTPEHHEIGIRLRKLDQDVAKIVGKINHVRRPRTKRHGISERSYRGSSLPASDQLRRVSSATSATAAAPVTGSKSTPASPNRDRCNIARLLRAAARVARA